MLVMQASPVSKPAQANVQTGTDVQTDKAGPARARLNTIRILSNPDLSHEDGIKLLRSLLMATQLLIKARVKGGAIDADLQPLRAEESIYQNVIFDSKAREILRANPNPTPAAERKLTLSMPLRNVTDAMLNSPVLDDAHKKAWLERIHPYVLSEKKGPESREHAADLALFEPLPNTSLTPQAILSNKTFLTFCQDTQISPEAAGRILEASWKRISVYASYFEDMRHNPAASSRHKPRGSPDIVGLACAIAVVQENICAGFDAKAVLAKIDWETQFRENPAGNTGKGIGQLVKSTVLGIHQDLDSLNLILSRSSRPTLPDSTACFVMPDSGEFIPLVRKKRLNPELKKSGRPPKEVYESHLADMGHNMALMMATMLLKMNEARLAFTKPADLTRSNIITLLKRYRGSGNESVDAAYAKDVMGIYDALKGLKV